MINKTQKEIAEIISNLGETMKLNIESQRTLLKGIILDAVRQVVGDSKAFKCATFTAYTPYFNDGDECNYWCSAGDAQINDFDYWGAEASDFGFEGDITNEPHVNTQLPNPNYTPLKREDMNNQRYLYVEEPNPDYDPNLSVLKKNLQKLLGSVGEENWRLIVGDHVIVCVTLDEIKVTDYNHE